MLVKEATGGTSLSRGTLPTKCLCHKLFGCQWVFDEITGNWIGRDLLRSRGISIIKDYFFHSRPLSCLVFRGYWSPLYTGPLRASASNHDCLTNSYPATRFSPHPHPNCTHHNRCHMRYLHHRSPHLDSQLGWIECGDLRRTQILQTREKGNCW